MRLYINITIGAFLIALFVLNAYFLLFLGLEKSLNIHYSHIAL